MGSHQVDRGTSPLQLGSAVRARRHEATSVRHLQQFYALSAPRRVTNRLLQPLKQVGRRSGHHDLRRQDVDDEILTFNVD